MAQQVEFEVLDPPIRHYKYRLTRSYHHVLANYEPRARGAIGPWVTLDANYLFLREGYCWDGASGPAVDTPDFMAGSLVHDALYQLVAHSIIPRRPWKRYADNELVRVCKRAGMPWFRRVWVWSAVRIFGRANDRYAGV